MHHPKATDLPRDEIAQATDMLIKIAETGVELLPFTKTGIPSHDDKDAEMIGAVGKESKDWATIRNAYARFAT